MKSQCEERIWGGWRTNRCSRNAVKDGYCKQHHPDSIKEREKKSSELADKRYKESPIGRLHVALARIAELEAELEDIKGGIGR